MSIEIRKARMSDQAEWARLRAALWPDGTRAEHLRDLRSSWGRRGLSGWLAWREGHVVGFAEATIRPFANCCESRPVPFLEGLWVDAQARREGVGRALVAAVERWAAERGFAELGSDALIDNLESHHAHRAYGFKEIERVVYFRKELKKPRSSKR